MVERSAVNRLVVGSSPTSGAIFTAYASSAFKTLLERVNRSKGEFGSSVYVSNAGL